MHHLHGRGVTYPIQQQGDDPQSFESKARAYIIHIASLAPHYYPALRPFVVSASNAMWVTRQCKLDFEIEDPLYTRLSVLVCVCLRVMKFIFLDKELLDFDRWFSSFFNWIVVVCI